MSKSAGTILYDHIKQIEAGQKSFGENAFANPMDFLDHMFKNYFGKQAEEGFLYWAKQSEPSPKRKFLNQPHTCPKRMLEPGPWEHKDGLDDWEQRGKARACSFCGSMHPEDLLTFCGKVDGINNYITRKGSVGRITKLYIRDKDVANASEGPIKFYTTHLRYIPDPAQSELIEKVERAMKLTNIQEAKRMEIYKAELQAATEEKEEDGKTP